MQDWYIPKIRSNLLSFEIVYSLRLWYAKNTFEDFGDKGKHLRQNLDFYKITRIDLFSRSSV